MSPALTRSNEIAKTILDDWDNATLSEEQEIELREEAAALWWEMSDEEQVAHEDYITSWVLEHPDSSFSKKYKKPNRDK